MRVKQRVDEKWPELLKAYFSIELTPAQYQTWAEELNGETDANICAAIRWASKNWKRPDFVQINMTTLQAWLYKSQTGGMAEQQTRARIEYQQKMDDIVAQKCALIDEAKGKSEIASIVESVDYRLQTRLASHALAWRRFDYYAYKRGEDCVVRPAEGPSVFGAVAARAKSGEAE